jgi:4-aminobutyrate aminotransferase
MANLANFTKHIGAGVGRMSQIIMEKGKGSWVWTTSGEKYLDFTSGIGVTSTGHCHPKVVKAVQDQVAKIVHAQV